MATLQHLLQFASCPPGQFARCFHCACPRRVYLGSHHSQEYHSTCLWRLLNLVKLSSALPHFQSMWCTCSILRSVCLSQLHSDVLGQSVSRQYCLFFTVLPHKLSHCRIVHIIEKPFSRQFHPSNHHIDQHYFLIMVCCLQWSVATSIMVLT